MQRLFLSPETSAHLVPGTNILLQQPGNRNCSVLNPKKGEERPLLNNDAVGWIFTPVYSPDGGKIAVLWNRRPARGIWVIFLKDSSQRPVHKSESFISPIGWSTDGNWIYALEERKVLMISVTGLKARTLVTLPFEGIGNVSMTADGRRFVCSVYESLSNIWMVENFDPEMAFQAATRQSPPQSR